MGGKNEEEKKRVDRYHPYKRKERSSSGSSEEKENNSGLLKMVKGGNGGGGVMKKKIKLKEGGDGEKGMEEIGGAKKLERMKKQLCPKELKVSVERLRCKEIMVTVPCKGKREIFYWSYASESEDEEDDEEDGDKVILLDCDGNPLPCGRRVLNSSHLKYEDWRVQTIKAYPSSGGGGGEDSPDAPPPPPPISIQVPFYRDHVFKVGHAQDDLHTILDLLTGGSSSTMMIDAYLLLRLEKYFKDMSKQALHYKLKIIGGRGDTSGGSPYEFRGTSKKNLDEGRRRPPPPPPPQPPKVINYHYLSLNFLPVKDRDDPVTSFKPNLHYLPDLTQLTKDVQLIAPLYASKHLYLAVFNFRLKVVTVYDSSWHYLPKELREGQVTTILRYLLNNQQDLDTTLSEPYTKSLFSQWKIDWQNRSCPQYDEYSCGIYTIHYAENVLRGIANEKHHWKLSDRRVMQIRRQIAKELLATTQVGRQLFRAISCSGWDLLDEN